jgi:DNA-binding response OmpR family regulator
LENGADSFLAKPFLPRQMLAHLRALSRRVRSTLVRNPSTIITVGPLRVDTVRHEVSVNSKNVRLTPTESRLLHLLAANANDICTLEQIVTHVWGFGGAGDTYLVKAHIRHLREKIEPVPGRPQYIITTPGVGYMLKRSVTGARYAVEEVQPAEDFDDPEQG